MSHARIIDARCSACANARVHASSSSRPATGSQLRPAQPGLHTLKSAAGVRAAAIHARFGHAGCTACMCVRLCRASRRMLQSSQACTHAACRAAGLPFRHFLERRPIHQQMMRPASACVQHAARARVRGPSAFVPAGACAAVTRLRNSVVKSPRRVGSGGPARWLKTWGTAQRRQLACRFPAPSHEIFPRFKLLLIVFEASRPASARPAASRVK